MQLRFLGKNSTPGDSPTLYATDQDSYVIQGWKVYANDLLVQLDVPEGQTVIEVPTELFEHLKKDGQLSGEIAQFNDPIKIVTEGGTCILQGPEMHDAEALEQMRMPDYETCIEVPKSSITALLEEDRGPDHVGAT
ncbi:hypothetical protein KQH42_27805 [Streptomyces sp. CHA1]|uniref:hypothetical protein n=1 Tax=Streptomyces TaxID=1883 RepID=UPI001BFC874B|nr:MULTISPECIES: hypothetical protein [unclassified Streptomyces]WTD01419.1 hypothetical protein OH717_01955 [Streptomyces albidoflavus]MBT3160585.1 hypothetical protein [Streptomyces sp. G11C]MCO6704235.1 hypothetical protein [Streptomyces sp. CHB9.2]MCO6710509.1 hypothetical protein [Streptomyces sp. CHA3]MCO6716304.1 hypothetical protein [Streptomyces sp. CHB19.2]